MKLYSVIPDIKTNELKVYAIRVNRDTPKSYWVTSCYASEYKSRFDKGKHGTHLTPKEALEDYLGLLEKEKKELLKKIKKIEINMDQVNDLIGHGENGTLEIFKR